MYHVTAIELGVDSHGELEPLHCVPRNLRVGNGGNEVSAERNEHIASPVDDRLKCIHHRAPTLLGRTEAEHLLDLAKQLCARLLVDADSPVTLHVGMAANGTDAGAGPADITTHHEEVGDLLHVLRAVSVLGDAHAVADDDGFGLDVDLSDPLNLGPLQARDVQN